MRFEIQGGHVLSNFGNGMVTRPYLIDHDDPDFYSDLSTLKENLEELKELRGEVIELRNYKSRVQSILKG